MKELTVFNENEYHKNKKELIRRVKAGEIFIYPTDTIAGIGCLASNKESVEKIFSIKERSLDKPVSIAVGEVKQLQDYIEITDNLTKLLKFFPGKLTIVARRHETKEVYGVGKNAIGLRIPAIPWLNELCKEVGAIITTSANLSGEKPASEFKLIDKRILNKVDFAIRWEGKLSEEASTVVSVIDNKIKILRQGKLKITL